ncbi:MAG: InlB B-repeat-containing protein [Synergistaceae bacterium]|nr:InlB B-repeat-containing protein [Synergistaceae bacterium]
MKSNGSKPAVLLAMALTLVFCSGAADADFVKVISIDDVPKKIEVGVSFDLTGTVLPIDATNQDIIWNIIDDGSTGATLSGDTLFAPNEGIVTVRASVVNDPYGNDWDKVSVGAAGSCFIIRKDDSLWAWGNNYYGQLGDGSRINRSYLVQVGTDNNWDAVVAGANHTIGKKTDGSLLTWGYNSSGQIGNGTSSTTDFVLNPTLVGLTTDWKTIAAGYHYTMATKTDGNLWVWGNNQYGQLGIDTDGKSQTIPFNVGTGYNLASIDAGFGHTIEIKIDGNLWAWGRNDYGQLGNGLTTNSYTPVQEETSAKNWAAVAAGYDHTAAIKTDGSLWTWGSNENGKLGYDLTTQCNSPDQMGMDKNWAAVTVGQYHTIAIKTDGSLWAWGGNSKGQLCDGTTTNNSSPKRVGTANNWVAVFSGGEYSMAKKTDGSLWAWGMNSNGQLGDGTLGNINVAPVLVSGYNEDFTVRIVKAFKVTFVDCDGTVLDTQTVLYEDPATAPPDPVRAGHTFIGWDVDFSNITSDLTVKAVYDTYTYTVTFMSDGKVFNTQTVEHGKAAVDPGVPTKPGYTFAGWDKDFSNITSDLTVNALFTVGNFTVTFVDWNEDVIIKRTVPYGMGVTAPADPVRPGYTFAGWDKDFTSITSDLTVTATYNINYYTVTFVDWNGEALKKDTVAFGTSATAPANPARQGYTFARWNRDFSFVTVDLTVTALYDPNKYTVTFLNWDGAVIISYQVEHGLSATAPADPARAGYTFTGWDVNFSHITGNLTVTAQFKSNTTASYTVYFVANRVVINHQTVEHGGAAKSPGTPVKQGYTFTGWDKNFSNITSNLTVIAQFKSNTAASHNVVFMADSAEFSRQTVEHENAAVNPGVPTKQDCTFAGWDKGYSNIISDLTVSAQFKDITNPVYTVTFMANDREFSRQTVEYGRAAHDPGEPFKEGHTFTNWDRDFSFITSGLTVGAQFVINTYTVIFMVDGVEFNRQTVEHGDDATDPGAPVKEGYIFADWDSNIKNITSDLTVSAMYEEIIYFVPVTDIVGAPDTAILNTPLTLTGTVIPDNATNKKIVWSVKDAESTGAVIFGDALFSAKPGEVVVTAMIWGGVESRLRYANFIKDFTVIVRNAISGISLDPATNMNFGSVSERYSAVNPRAVTVNNIGAAATGALNIALSGKNASSFALNKTSMPNIAVEGSDSFSVAPITGLKAGTYEATVTVSGGADIDPQSFNVSFTVESTSKKGGGGCNAGFFLGYGLLALLVPLKKIK